MRRQDARCGSWAAADINQGIEPAAGGNVVVDDSLVQVGVVVRAGFGVRGALFRCVGIEGLLGGEDGG